MLFYSLVLLALFASAQGRAVNISNTWVLPEEGFPVFYRYFRDRISWYEADAVCQFHHANLVTVDTTAQYDAVRAYLKELDISSAVWVGLIRSNPDGDFTWTDYRGLSGEGYWSSAPDTRASPLCAAADPAADYRWEARACGGPTVASFICELPVPQWALGSEGCMVRALPACTILYLPESAAVQLTADCGLAGVKRVQCTGNVKREALLKDLSCAEDDELSTIMSLTSSGNTWAATTDAINVEQETITETATEEFGTTEHEGDLNQSSTTLLPLSSTLNVNAITGEELSTKSVNINKFNTIDDSLYKNNELHLIHSNNLQSNHIPKNPNMDNFLSNEYQDKIEDEKNMQHKMLHEEIARLGNLENIFTQPTDHFIPPLVMAKAKISNDMTVLSLQEKHAQQLAEQYESKHSNEYHDIDNIKSTTEIPKAVPSTIDKILFVHAPGKQDKIKTNMPKKYIEKVYDPKSKIQKIIETKPNALNKSTESIVTTPKIQTEELKINTLPLVGRSNDDEDSTLNLTVFLNDRPEVHEEKMFYNYSGDISKLEIVKNSTVNDDTEIKLLDIEATELTKDETHIENLGKNIHNFTLYETVAKTTNTLENYSTAAPTVFKVITEASLLLRNVSVNQSTTVTDMEGNITVTATSKKEDESTENPFEGASLHSGSEQLLSMKFNFHNDTLEVDEEESFKLQNITRTTTVPVINISFDITNMSTKDNIITETTITNGPFTTHEDDNENNSPEHHEEFGANSNSSDTLDDFNSPLLSGANEPVRRPNRSRRPLPPPNRNKFNPFRILG